MLNAGQLKHQTPFESARGTRIAFRYDQDVWSFAACLVTGSDSRIFALTSGQLWEENFQGDIAVFNQLTPISTAQMRGLQAIRPAILIIILLVWIGLPVVAS